MALELNGTTGVSLVQNGVLTDANMPAGSVLQVPAQAVTWTQINSNTTTWTDWSGMSVSITPSSASNKVLILATLYVLSNTNAENTLVRILRDSTDIVHGGDYIGYVNLAGASGIGGTQVIMYLDSPSTTSSVTYKVQYRSDAGGNIILNCNDSSSTRLGDESTNSTLTVLEIAG